MDSPKHLNLPSSKKAAVLYHNIFNYPLTKKELAKWEVNLKFLSAQSGLPAGRQVKIENSNRYYFIKGRKELINLRYQNEKESQKKLKIAQSAAKTLFKIPTIKFIGLTGSLAMNNANKNSDIDFLIITQEGLLWTTRLFTYFIIYFSYLIPNTKYLIPRRFGSKYEKDRLCLNMWLDEKDLFFEDHNLFTAHEIAQIVPLINKDYTYEKFLSKNKWVLNFWPKAGSTKYQISDLPAQAGIKYQKNILNTFEKIAFHLQYQYMKRKITHELITPTRALFHPRELSKNILKHLY